MNKIKQADLVLQGEDIRGVCRQVAPYIARQWREVCEELGVSDDVLDSLEETGSDVRLSELAFRGLCAWHDKACKNANREKLLKAVQCCGLRRAEDFLKSTGQKRSVPCLARPTTAPEVSESKQARQKATLDRLSRPKTVASQDQKPSRTKNTNLTSKHKPDMLTLQKPAIKPNDICEVKIKITVKGVQRIEKGEMESTRDNFQSTKDDFKHTCYTFIKLAMADQKVHFIKLKEHLGFDGISIQRLTKVGFNINLFILCFNLGAFEMLYQSYSHGRLKNIISMCLITDAYLEKLQAKGLDLSVTIEEGLVNTCREILILRGTSEPIEQHPADMLDDLEMEDEESDKQAQCEDDANTFYLTPWISQLDSEVEIIDLRYKKFMESSSDFLMALRILRPVNSGRISCLQEVLNLFHSLRKSRSSSQVAQKDLLGEYLAIVNNIRIKTVYIRDNDLFISFDDSLDARNCDTFHERLGDLEAMLDPNHQFAADDNKMIEAYSGIEQESFGGVICYIPALLDKISSVCDSLKKTPEETEELNDNQDSEINNNEKSTDKNIPNGEPEVSTKTPSDDLPVASTKYLTTWTPPVLVTFHD